jgi:hypothetical protein
MTIRVKCEFCGSVLKIKDRLAGTDGHCPKCKASFVVPQLADAADEGPPEQVPNQPDSVAAPPSAAAEKPSKSKASNRDDAEFDPVAFLLDDSAPNAKASAGLTTPDPISKKPAAYGRGGRNAALNASANARDLLTKTMEDSRGKAGSLPAEKPRQQIDVVASLYPLWAAAPYLVGILVVAGGLYWMSSQMLGGRLPLPELGAVRGTITIDGQPLQNAVIYLTPINKDGEDRSGRKLRLRTPKGVTDERGQFTIEYMPGVPGAPLGGVTISIEPGNPQDYYRIPPTHLINQFNTDVREVQRSGNEGKFDINLESTRK